MAFSDDEFNAAAKDAEYPDLDGWEFFVESHGVKIYRLYCSVGTLCCHTIAYIGIIKNKTIPCDIIAKVKLWSVISFVKAYN